MKAPRPSWSPWQRLYGAVLHHRRARLTRRAERLPAPVVSVGNLHFGGGGKTPMTIALAAHLRDRGLAVAILSRGYRRSSRGPLLVSRGNGPVVSWRAAGDEPYLLAEALPGVPVAVAEERVAAGRLAIERLDRQPDLFLLDDGFSHAALARDLDLLLFPADDPFARGRLAPSGRLREPLAAARHADAAILTGAAPGGETAGEELATALRPYGFAGPGFASPTGFLAPALEAESRIVAVAGIARPASFFRRLEQEGATIAARLPFADHHAYPDESIARIEGAFRRHRATAVVATAKDAVKLAGRLSSPLLVAGIEARPELTFWTWFDERIDALAGGGAR
ncbi:MAG: tetraacyldisaccharide 4'-kinase [Thermoanaerobaculia bacterium]